MIEDFEADFAKYEQPKKDKSKPSDGSDFDADFAKYETASIGSGSNAEEEAPPAPAVGAVGTTPVGSMAWEAEKKMGQDRSKQSFEKAASEVVTGWNTQPEPKPETEDYSKGYKVELSPEELGYFDRRKNATLAGLQIAKNKAKTILGTIPAAIVSPGAPSKIAISGAEAALGAIKSIVAPGTPGIESKYVNEDFNKVREVDLSDGTKQQVRFGDNAIRMQGPQGLRFYHKDPDGVLRVAKPILSPEDTIQMRKEKATSREDRIKRAASRILKKQDSGADAGVIGRIDYSVSRMFDELGAGITEQVADLLPDNLKLSTLAKVSPALALTIRNSGIKSDATVKDLADFAREKQEAYMRASNEMADDYAAEGKYIQAFVARNLQNTGSQVAAQSSLLAASALTGTVAGASARVLGASERGARVVAAVASSLPEGYQEGQGVKREVFQSFKDKGYSDAGAMAYAQDAADKTLAANVLLQAPGNIIGLGVEGKILKKINEGEKAAVKALAKKSVLKSAVKSTYEYGKDLFYQTGEEGLQKAISMGAGETAGGVGSDFALTAVRSVFTKEALDEALSALPVVALMGGGSALVESRNKRAEAKAAKESEVLSDIGKAEELLKAKIGEATAKTAPEAVSEPVSPDPEMQAYEQEMSAVVAQTGQSLDAVVEEVANSRPEVADLIKTNVEAVKAKLVQEGNVENFSKYAAVALNPVIQYGPVGVEFARVASNANVFNNAASVLSALPTASVQTVNELLQAKQKEVDTAIAEHKAAIDAVEASKAAENDLGTVSKLAKAANDKAKAVKAKAKKASVEIETKVKPIVVEAKAKVESDLKAASKEIVEPMAVAPTAEPQKFIVGSRVSKDRNWTNASLQEVRQEVRRPIEEFESSRKGVYPDFMTPQEVSDLERNISYQLGNIAEREIGYNLMEDSKATPGTPRHDRVMEDLKRDMQKLKELDKKYASYKTSDVEPTTITAKGDIYGQAGVSPEKETNGSLEVGRKHGRIYDYKDETDKSRERIVSDIDNIFTSESYHGIKPEWSVYGIKKAPIESVKTVRTEDCVVTLSKKTLKVSLSDAELMMFNKNIPKDASEVDVDVFDMFIRGGKLGDTQYIATISVYKNTMFVDLIASNKRSKSMAISKEESSGVGKIAYSGISRIIKDIFPSVENVYGIIVSETSFISRSKFYGTTWKPRPKIMITPIDSIINMKLYEPFSASEKSKLVNIFNRSGEYILHEAANSAYSDLTQNRKIASTAVKEENKTNVEPISINPSDDIDSIVYKLDLSMPWLTDDEMAKEISRLTGQQVNVSSLPKRKISSPGHMTAEEAQDYLANKRPDGVTADDFIEELSKIVESKASIVALRKAGLLNTVVSQADANKLGIGKNTRAVVRTENGKKAVYFVLHRINNVKKIIPLFMHEIGVHVGLKGFMGDKYRDLLKMVADAVVKGDAQLKYAFDLVQKGYGEKESYQKFSTMDAMEIFNEGSEASERFLEEVIAQVVNTMEFEKSFTGYMKEISKRIIASIKAWLSGRGFNVKAITRDHLNYIVKGSFDAVVREAESFAKAQQQSYAQESEEVVSEKISFVVAGKKVTAEIKGKDAIEAFNTAQALNTVLQAEAAGNPEKHKMVADMFSQFKKDLAEDNIKSRPFPIPLAEMLFGDKSAWFTMTGADYIETMKANKLLLGTEAATKERLIGIGLSKTDAQTAAKEARRFHTYAEFVPESDKVKQKKAEAIVDAVSEEELPSLSVDKNSPLWSVLEESSTVRRPEGYSSVTLEFATRAFLALTGGKKFQNLAATLRSYSSAINEAKMKLNPYLETMGKAVKSERDNQILGWLLGFSTVQNDNKGIKLPEEWIRLAFPGISDELIGAYNAGWMFGQVAKTEQIDAARILNNNLKKKVLASNVSIDSKAKAIEKLDASIKEMVDNYNSKDFYWPLSRFGKYMYRFRDKEGNVVANFIVEEEGKKGDMELRKQIVEACQADSNFKKLYENNEYVQDKSPVVLADIDDLSGNTAMSVDNVMLDYFTAARRAVEDNADALDALKLDVMSAKFEHFAKKHEVHRRGVPGWSTDALKVASVYAHGVSSTVANSTMAVELDNVLEQFSQQKLGSQYDPKNFNTARDMIDNAKNPPFRPSLNKLLGGGFLLHIGGRPSFFIAQKMQQLQSILPTMDRYYHGISTVIAMAKAEKIAYSLTGIKKLDRFETISIEELEDLLNSKINWKTFRGLMKSEEKAKACADMVKAVLSRSIRQGSLQAQPSFGYTENVIKKFTDKLVGALGVFALKGEQINRIVALTTWTILNMAEGEVQFTDESGYTKDENNEAIFKELQDKAQEIEMSDVFERIYQTAENINELTNYVRGRGNQPGYMRHTGFKGSVIAAATNYKSFGLLNIMQFHAMGLIEAKRKRGKVAKVLAYARPQIVNAGIMALLAGPQSYVFFKLLDALIPDEFLLPIYDSIATKLKAYIREYFAMAGTDPKTANQWTNRIYYSLTNGAPNLTGADISGMLRNDLIDTKGNGAEIFAHNIAGATGSNLMDAYTAYSEKGIAAASKKLMPSLARGPIEAIEGKTSVGSGKTKLSAYERSLRAFSLQPTRIGYLRGESEMQFRFYGNVKKDLESELKDRAKRSAQSNDGKIEASVSKSIYKDVAQFNKDWKDFIVKHGQQRIDASKIISGVRYQRKATKKLFRITKEEEVK